MAFTEGFSICSCDTFQYRKLSPSRNSGISFTLSIFALPTVVDIIRCELTSEKALIELTVFSKLPLPRSLSWTPFSPSNDICTYKLCAIRSFNASAISVENTPLELIRTRLKRLHAISTMSKKFGWRVGSPPVIITDPMLSNIPSMDSNI